MATMVQVCLFVVLLVGFVCKFGLGKEVFYDENVDNTELANKLAKQLAIQSRMAQNNGNTPSLSSHPMRSLQEERKIEQVVAEEERMQRFLNERREWGPKQWLKENKGDGLPAFVFVKTHKTGSSTLTVTLLNMLLKYGHTAEFGRNSELNWPSVYKRTNALVADLSMPVDALVNHIMWSKMSATNAYTTLKGRAFTFTILRDPLTRFVSSWRYFNDRAAVIARVLNMDKDCFEGLDEPCLAQFLDKVEQSPPKDEVTRRLSVILASYTVDLGLGNTSGSSIPFRNFFPKPLVENKKRFESLVADLSKRMDLVLFTEQWELSMVLLARYLGVNASEDLLWWKEKSSAPSTTSWTKAIPKHLLEQFKRVFWREYMVYDTYKEQFVRIKTLLAEEDGGMGKLESEVAHLKDAQGRMTDVCDMMFMKNCKERKREFNGVMDVYEVMKVMWDDRKHSSGAKFPYKVGINYTRAKPGQQRK
eukprot:m.8953 g.8953  ORF g.8953 m.8953 type:complete len:476 (-) comp3313_c0_seq1:58-1485(-)